MAIAKVIIKSEKLTLFGGMFPVMEQFDSGLTSVIDSTLGFRCKLYGYQYSEIIRSLMRIYSRGGPCPQEITPISLYPSRFIRHFVLAVLTPS